MCLSGDIQDLSPERWKLVVSAMELQRRIHPIIRDGHSTFHGETGRSWRHPQGWQAVLRTGRGGRHALPVAHTFARPFPRKVTLPLPPGRGWKIAETWPASGGLAVKTGAGRQIEIGLNGEFRSAVVWIESTANSTF